MKKFTLKTLVITLFTLAAAPFAKAQYHDDFNGANDTLGLQARGYLTYFRSGGAPGSDPYWTQGNPGLFSAFNGNDSDFVQSSYQSVTGANNIDNWLVLPALNVSAGDGISFYSRSVTGSTFPDSIRVMYSAAGDSTPEDTSWVKLGNFKVNTLGIWQLKTFFVNSAGTNGRFAIRYNVVNGGPTGVNSDNIGIDELNVFTPAAVDGGVSAINVSSGCSLSTLSPINVTIENFGLNPISNFPVSYTINGGSAITETYTGIINAASTATYTFTATANFSSPGNYTIEALTSITSDGNAANDSDTLTISSMQPISIVGTPQVEDFESAALNGVPAGWSTEDVDSSGVTWGTINTFPNGGTNAIRAFENNVTGVASEDWLYTPCIDMLSSHNYKLTFYKRLTTGYNGELGVYIGSGINFGAMTQIIEADIALAPDGLYYLDTLTFTVPINGAYNIGFKAANTDTSNTIAIRLDDYQLEDLGPVGIKEISKAVVSIYPNPSNGLFKISTVSNSTDVNVYNSIGENVYSKSKLSAGVHLLDITNLPIGIYTIKAFSENTVELKKITINK